MCSDLTTNDWWTGDQWTDQHFEVAKRLMRKVHILPPAWHDDVIQDIALRYSTAIKSRKGRNPAGWLYKLLHNRAIEIHDKEFCIRGRFRKTNRPKRFVGIEVLELDRFTARAPEHHEDWRHLVLHSTLQNIPLTDGELQTAASHCYDCTECGRIVGGINSKQYPVATQRTLLRQGFTYLFVLFSVPNRRTCTTVTGSRFTMPDPIAVLGETAQAERRAGRKFHAHLAFQGARFLVKQKASSAAGRGQRNRANIAT